MGEEGTAKAQRQKGVLWLAQGYPEKPSGRLHSGFPKIAFLLWWGKQKEPPEDLCREQNLEPSIEGPVVLGKPGDWTG